MPVFCAEVFVSGHIFGNVAMINPPELSSKSLHFTSAWRESSIRPINGIIVLRPLWAGAGGGRAE